MQQYLDTITLFHSYFGGKFLRGATTKVFQAVFSSNRISFLYF